MQTKQSRHGGIQSVVKDESRNFVPRCCRTKLPRVRQKSNPRIRIEYLVP